MFFVINKANFSVENAKAFLVIKAKRRILQYKMKAADIELSNYLVTIYKLPLKYLCLKLLNSISISVNNQNELIVMFNNKKADDLASLITYGNLNTQKSKILKYAFMQN